MSPWDTLVAAGHAARQVELAPHTTYKLGGPADLFVEVGDRRVLEEVGEAWQAEPRPVLVLGRGSNLLVSDRGFDGVVVRLGAAFAAVSMEGDVVEAGAAQTMPRLARAAGAAGRGGLEWCVGVPGSVGGAVRQNAGCFGSEIADVLVDVEMFSLSDRIFRISPAPTLDLSYRHSSVAATDVVVSARFVTTATNPDEAAAKMRQMTRWRKEHQPGGTLNAGSVFKNPASEAAGALIDRLGLKGFSVGRVRVSPRHANFIEAEAGASAADVVALITTVQAEVKRRSGVELEPEIQFVGFGEE